MSDGTDVPALGSFDIKSNNLDFLLFEKILKIFHLKYSLFWIAFKSYQNRSLKESFYQIE